MVEIAPTKQMGTLLVIVRADGLGIHARVSRNHIRYMKNPKITQKNSIFWLVAKNIVFRWFIHCAGVILVVVRVSGDISEGRGFEIRPCHWVTFFEKHLYCISIISRNSAVYQRQTSKGSLVQSLNSPFFPPHIVAEPGRAKRESRITCMRMLRTPPFFPPKSWEKPYLEARFRFGLSREFLNNNIQATIFAFWVVKKHFR